MRNEPSNVTCLAAELAAFAPPKWRARPFRAAALATELCALGRAYKAVSERLCGGEDTWGRYPEAGPRIARAEKRKAALEAKARKLLKESPYSKAYLVLGDLTLYVFHVENKCTRESTVLL